MLTSVKPSLPLLYLGNCLDILPTLEDESVDLLITDPPYGINYQSRSHSLALTKIANDKGDEAYSLLDKVLAIAAQKLKPDRHVYIFTNWQAFEGMAPIVRKYFKLKGALAWIKNNRTRGDLKGNYGYQYEMVLYAHKGRRWLFGKRDSDVLQFSKVPTQAMQHPTEKPVALLKYLIEKSTLPGEVILDPFMGSGSTGEAALASDRRFIGIEMEPVWFPVAKKRLEQSA
jgi:site-specific DNA-methyltransferase (adenine-specific)